MSNIEHDEIIDEVDAVDNTEMSPPKTESPKENSVGPQGPEMDREARNEPVKSKDLTPKAESKSAMGLDSRGLVAPKDSSESWRLAELFLKSKAIPKQFENVPQVFMARQFLLAHGLNPEIGIRQCTIINGTLSIWGDLPLAICERSGLIEHFREFLIDKDYNEISFGNKNLGAEIFAAVCITKRKDKEAITRTFTVAEAKTADLWKKDIWQKYPKRMLQMRVRSLALKDAYSDVLSGVAINEYDYDTTIESGVARDVLPNGMKNVAEEMNEAFIGIEANADQGQPSPSVN